MPRNHARALLLCLAAPLLMAPTGPDDITVPTLEYPTLASAMAVAGDNTTIWVDASLWVGETSAVTVTADVTIRGLNGLPDLPPLDVVAQDLTLIDVDLGGRTLLSPILFEDLLLAEVTNDDFVAGEHAIDLLGGSLTATSVEILPGAPRGVVANDADVVLTSCFAEGFSTGRVVTVVGRSLTVDGGVFSENSGGVFRTTNAGVQMDYTQFYGNGAEQGADLFATGSGEDVSLFGVYSQGSTATAEGGSLYADGVDLLVTTSGFETSTAGGAGGAILAKGESGSLSVEDVLFDTTSSWTAGGGLSALETDVDLWQVSFEACQAPLGGGVDMTGGTLGAYDVENNGTTASYGGTFHLDNVTATVSEYTHHVDQSAGDAAAIDGGGFEVSSSSLHLIEVATSGVHVTGDGALVHAVTGQVTVTGGRSDDLVSDGYGALVRGEGTDITLDGHQAFGHAAIKGASVYASGGQVVVHDSRFEDHDAWESAAVYVTAGGTAEVERTLFCHNSGGAGASAVHLNGTTELDALRSNLFVGNDNTHAEVGDSGSVLIAEQADTNQVDGTRWVAVVNNDFVDNGPGAAALDLRSARVSVVNNIFQGSGGYVTAGTGTRLGFTAGYNLFHAVDGTADPNNIPDFPSNTAVFGDPEFQEYTFGDCDSNFWLADGSPALDTGSPEVFDLDGSRSDIGAYGGPDADLWDGDGDGSYVDRDCDDTDSSRHPGAEEFPYDGIDQDCDGEDLVDYDGDGYDSWEVDGPDCNDFAAQVHPDAEEVPYNGVDEDCSGQDLGDVDGDGYDAWQVGGPDCDDEQAQVNPGVDEVWYDGLDADCDGNDDDADYDGFAAEQVGGNDCDDNDADIHPMARDVYNDDIDQDCDGVDTSSWLGGSGRGCVSAPASLPALGPGLVFALVLFRRRTGGGRRTW